MESWVSDLVHIIIRNKSMTKAIDTAPRTMEYIDRAMLPTA